MADDPWRDAVVEEIRQLLDEIIYTEKAHFASAERLQKQHLRLGVVATVLAAIAAATIVAEHPLVAGVAALLATLASGVATFTKPESKAQQHLATGRRLAAIRVALRQLLNLELPALERADAIERVRNLSEQKAQVDQAGPGTFQQDYSVGSGKVKSGLFDRDR